MYSFYEMRILRALLVATSSPEGRHWNGYANESYGTITFAVRSEGRLQPPASDLDWEKRIAGERQMLARLMVTVMSFKFRRSQQWDVE